MAEEEAKKAAEASSAWGGAVGNVAATIEPGYDAGYDEAGYEHSHYPAIDGSDTGWSRVFRTAPCMRAHASNTQPIDLCVTSLA